MQRPTITDDNLLRIQATIREAVKGEHPGVRFTDIWIDPRVSWYGSDMIDVWAIYDGEVKDLSPPDPKRPSLHMLMQDIIRDSGVDAFPGLHLVAKSDVEGSHA